MWCWRRLKRKRSVKTDKWREGFQQQQQHGPRSEEGLVDGGDVAARRQHQNAALKGAGTRRASSAHDSVQFIQKRGQDATVQTVSIFTAATSAGENKKVTSKGNWSKWCGPHRL